MNNFIRDSEALLSHSKTLSSGGNLNNIHTETGSRGAMQTLKTE